LSHTQTGGSGSVIGVFLRKRANSPAGSVGAAGGLADSPNGPRNVEGY